MAHDDQHEIAHGERTIEIKIRLFTDELDANDKSAIVPKHAWTGGTVRATRNEAHGIQGGDARIFHTLLELPSAIEQVLIDHGIQLHASPSQAKYLA